MKPEHETIDPKEAARENVRRLAAEYAERGDLVGWFEALYKEWEVNPDVIPWADMEPNEFLTRWAEKNDMQGNGRTALVVGCGLGDDARYLYDRGFKVTAFDISPTAIACAKRLHAETDIVFEAADLFEPRPGWLGAFEFVLEVYTIQPLPIGMRPRVIDAIGAFVAPGGKLLVVTRGREDDEEPVELPWALSRRDLSRFEQNGLRHTGFEIMMGDEDEPIPRFVVEYTRV